MRLKMEVCAKFKQGKQVWVVSNHGNVWTRTGGKAFVVEDKKGYKTMNGPKKTMNGPKSLV